MLKKFISTYRTPLLLSVTISIILVALNTRMSPFDIGLTIVGCLLGTFLLDLDYFIYAFFLEPENDFSKTLAGFVKHRDLGNAFLYISYHAEEIKDKTLHSALFQIVFVLLTVFVASSNTSVIVKGIAISASANSVYRLFEYYFKGKIDEWFWALKNKPGKYGFYAYTAAMIILICLSLGMF